MRGDTAAMRQAMEARYAKMKTDLNLTQVQADSIKAITCGPYGKTAGS